MAFFPQISTGVIAQYPIVKRLSRRLVVNELPGGHVIRAGDPDAYTVSWELRYSGLTDAERVAIETFFEEMEGRLRTFVFLDPTANLMQWSADLSNDVWVRDGLLQVQENTDAWRLVNAGQTAQGIEQVVSAPASMRYALSCFVRASEPCGVVLSAGEGSVEFAAGSAWERVICSGVPGVGDQVRCRLAVAPGGSVEVYGMQLEPQPMASAYKASAQAAGVHAAARFDQDRLDFTAHGIDDHAVTLRIVSRAGE